MRPSATSWELPLADKLALFGTAALVIFTFFPWKETVAEGDVLGVFSSGVLVTLLGSAAVAGIIVRTRKTMPTLNPLLPWVAQLGCVGVSAIWCLVYMKLSWDSTPAMSAVGNYEVWVSKPAIRAHPRDHRVDRVDRRDDLRLEGRGPLIPRR